MDYYTISKQTIDLLYQSYQSLKDSPLDQKLRSLIEIYVSKINGCEYCVRVHTQEAIKSGVSQEKIEDLASWSTSDQFNEAEKAALKWSEGVNQINHATDRSLLEPHYSEREIVDLTATVALMNALNRVAIYLRG